MFSFVFGIEYDNEFGFGSCFRFDFECGVASDVCIYTNKNIFIDKL